MESNLNKKIYFRFVDEKDCKTLFDWRNDPEVRTQSGDKSELKYKNHEEWFKNALSNQEIIIFIMLNEDYKEIGQVRINITNNENIISISLDKNYRGKGYGKLSIKKASEIFLNNFKLREIIALIKKDNIPSIKVFEKSGYQFSKFEKGFNYYIFKK